MEAENVVYIDGVPRDLRSFDVGQQYLLRQLTDLQQKLDRLNFERHQVEVAKRAFHEALVKSLEKGHDKTETETETEAKAEAESKASATAAAGG